jgi:hypothetical protein
MRLKVTVFWDVAPCSLVEVYRRFVSETSVDFYQTTRRNISELSSNFVITPLKTSGIFSA